jgi:hypothetical protein
MESITKRLKKMNAEYDAASTKASETISGVMHSLADRVVVLAGDNVSGIDDVYKLLMNTNYVVLRADNEASFIEMLERGHAKALLLVVDCDQFLAQIQPFVNGFDEPILVMAEDEDRVRKYMPQAQVCRQPEVVISCLGEIPGINGSD